MEHCPLLVTKLKERLEEDLPGVRVRSPLWKPVIGAYLLACNSVSWKAAAPQQ
jgi:hypothetical protein